MALLLSSAIHQFVLRFICGSSNVLTLASRLFTTPLKGAKHQLETAEKMSAQYSPGVSPRLSENVKEISLFDPDTKDSGFSEDIPEENGKIVSSPLSLEDNEATILCFSPEKGSIAATPYKNIYLGKKKRLFLSPNNGSPSVLAATSLKRLKIFELDNEEPTCTFGELPLELNFYDKILAETSDDEISSVPSVQVPKADSEDDDGVFPIRSFELQKNLVKAAVEKSEAEDLIGDFSKIYALPLIVGSHPDLKSISVDTMKDILEGKFKDVLTTVKIIDSRYPYEFAGGHIQGALNIYDGDECLKLLDKPMQSKDERHILIFHCEFSKERGPNMIRALRQEDRTRNTMNYPALTYPEVYVLDGGYKRFYESFPQYCDPMEYKQMLHPEHADEMRFFRKKSKSSENVMKTSKKKAPMSRSARIMRRYLSNDF